MVAVAASSVLVMSSAPVGLGVTTLSVGCMTVGVVLMFVVDVLMMVPLGVMASVTGVAGCGASLGTVVGVAVNCWRDWIVAVGVPIAPLRATVPVGTPLLRMIGTSTGTN